MSVALVERPSFTSVELCEILDISYRQLDYLCRTGAIPGRWQTGSGGRREFDAEIVDRLVVAAAVRDALPAGMVVRGAFTWPWIVEIVTRGPEPPRKAFALLTSDGSLSYAENVNVDSLVEGGLVVPYDLDDVPSL